jgi:hypothetical protein
MVAEAVVNGDPNPIVSEGYYVNVGDLIYGFTLMVSSTEWLVLIED